MLKQAAKDLDNQEDLLREKLRLAALDSFDILDTPREETFDRIARLIQNIFDVPIALVSMMDAHRQWYKACIGFGDNSEVARDESFCRIPVASGEPLVLPDLRSHPDWKDNIYVTGEPGVQFYAGFPLKTVEGHVLGTICAIDTRPRPFGERETSIMTDLAQIVMDELELRRTADTDSLTKILSRRAFRSQAERAVALAVRHKQPVSAVMIDVDHFKMVNDAHGHAVGDQVLVTVAEVCQAQLRATDLFGRLGGEEFAVILPNTDRIGAMDVAEKLRVSIRRKTIEVGNVAMRITASCGVSSLGEGVLELDTLLEEADRALYEAKAQGRDRSVSIVREQTPRPRRRVLKAGQIVFNNRFSAIDCTIRSLGEDGAGLDVWNAMMVPDKFTLTINPERAERTCFVTERGEKHIEVLFA